MGQNLIKPISNPFQNSSFLPPIKNTYSRTEPEETPAPRPSIFATLRKPPVAKANDFIPLFNDCITAASSRTQEYLLFKDPENKFHPSPDVLTQVSTRGGFSEILTHIQHWFCLQRPLLNTAGIIIVLQLKSDFPNPDFVSLSRSS